MYNVQPKRIATAWFAAQCIVGTAADDLYISRISRSDYSTT
ncbi:MAG: hypothetical protein WBW88_06850 [Rhodothermales bacterium]